MQEHSCILADVKLTALLSAAAAVVSIPAVQGWEAAGGSFTFTQNTRVVADEQLTTTAEVFADDLKALVGRDVAWRTGAASPGDIELRLGQIGHGPEAYRLTVADSIVVRGNTGTGVFHGTRTVLQWLRQSKNVPKGTATDWPKYPERGLLVDLGRKYFSIDWIRDRIREMSYLKLNYFHLHLSDRQGFRLASERHPEIVSDLHYTKHEIRDLIEYARRYHVQLVPEIDFPGHMDTVLAAHPDLKLVSRTGIVNDGAIDLSKPESYRLMADLLDEFLPLFPSQFWHIGADEYVTDYADYPQITQDTYYSFVNWANKIVRSHGKTARMYNDGLRPGATVDSDIIVEHWSANGPIGVPWLGPASTPRQLADAGHRIQNMAFTPTYYTTGGPASLFNVPPSAMYRWNPDTFIDGSKLPGHLGAKVSVWCDEPDARSEAQIADALRDRLRVLSQLTWGSPKPLLYLLFIPVMNAVGTPG